MIRLIKLRAVGNGEHRSGWPYCMDSLAPLFCDDSPIVFDDFTERTFLYDEKWHDDYVHEEPWIATMHHPPDMPRWYFDNLHLQKMIETPRFKASLPNLRMIVSMGDNLTQWCNQQWPHIPTVTVRHPTGRPLFYWDADRFQRIGKKRLVQVGWFLRNTLGIRHVAAPAWLTKTHLRQNLNWVRHANWLCEHAYKRMHPSRRELGNTEEIQQLDDTGYDLLLSESVVFVEVISAVANNTVVECIARNTPICINRHPGPEYYLGESYPLFYDDIRDVGRLLTTDNIMAAHQYLRTMDKWWIRGGMFCEQIRAACIEHIPECRQFTSLAHVVDTTEFRI